MAGSVSSEEDVSGDGGTESLAKSMPRSWPSRPERPSGTIAACDSEVHVKLMYKQTEYPSTSAQLAASDQSISPSLVEIANMESDNEFDNSGEFNSSGGTSLFSSFRRAKTVVASNSKHKQRNNLLREPSPARGSPSKHKHATRQRRTIDDSERRYEARGDPNSRHHRSHEMEYNKHDGRRHEHGSETCHESSGRSGHDAVKYKSSHREAHLSPLEKKLSNGSQRRHR